MNFDELISLLNRDIPKALDILDDVFEEDGVYIDLCKEWESPSNNFSLPNYRGRLIRYVKRNKRFYNSFKKEIEKDTQSFQQTSTDKIYELLCHLDFKHQSEYFDAIIKSSKNVIPFIIRGDKASGQKWLYNRLIHTYQGKHKKAIHQTVIISYDHFQTDIIGLLKSLISAFGGDLPEEDDDLKTWFYELRKAIIHRLDTASQFIVFKNAFDFVQSGDFLSFSTMLERVFNKQFKNDHKCILLFVENAPKPFEMANCIFSSKDRAFIARQKTDLNYIDLDVLSPLTSLCIEQWFDKVPDDYDITSIMNDIEDIINEHSGNPEKIIPLLCEKVIKVDYKQYENQWLKH